MKGARKEGVEVEFCEECGEVRMRCPDCGSWHRIDLVRKEDGLYWLYGADCIFESTPSAWEGIEAKVRKEAKSLEAFPVIEDHRRHMVV